MKVGYQSKPVKFSRADPVELAKFDPDYPQEWRYVSGAPACVAYVELGKPVIPPRCDHTADMFEEQP